MVSSIRTSGVKVPVIFTIHVIIHASSEITIREYLNPLQLDDSKLAKLNKLRTMAEMPVIML